MIVKVFNHKAVPMTRENEELYAHLKTEIKRLDAELAAARAMLKQIEHTPYGNPHWTNHRWCPCCRCHEPAHYVDCRLAALLKETT